MGLRLKRVADELADWWEAVQDWWQEIVVDNGPRYPKPGEWVHLIVDLFGATFQLFGRTFDRLHYTLGHAAPIGLTLWLLYEVLT